MEINTELINRLHARLKELLIIAEKEEFDKAVVIQRIKTINKDLAEMNSIRKEILVEHRKRETDFFEKLYLQDQTMKLFEKNLQKYVAYVDASLKGIEKSKKTNDKNQASDFLTDEKQQEIMNAFTIPENEIKTVLSNYNYRRIAAKRKRWIWWTNLLFHSNYWVHQITKLLLSTAIAYGLEKLADLIFETPDYLITAIVALLLFATGDRIIDKKFDRIFWNRIRKHSKNLYQHFHLYRSHMKSMLENKN